MALFSIKDLIGTSGQQNFAFSFPYLSRDHVRVYIDGVPNHAFTFLSAFVIRLTTPLPGDPMFPTTFTVRLRRLTPIEEPAVDFTNGSVLNEGDLDASVLQILFSMQELADISNISVGDSLVEQAGLSALASAASADASEASSLVASGYSASALDSMTQAASYRDAASVYQGQAHDSQLAAEASQESAAQSVLNAEIQKGECEVQAGIATTQAGLAATAKTACDTDVILTHNDVVTTASYVGFAASDVALTHADKASCDTSVYDAGNYSAIATASANSAIAAAASIATAFTSYVSNNGLQTTDRVCGLSGASFTLTLSTAVGHAGRMVDLIHLGTSLTQVYTIATTSSQTIAGCDGTATTFLLYTNGEKVTVISDGANWVALSHIAETGWIDAGAMTITGSTTDPTKPTTPDLDKVYWKRRGSQALVRYLFQASSNSGAANGSGAYLWALPTHLAFDSTIHPAVGTIIATATLSEGTKSVLPGTAKFWADSTGLDTDCIPLAYSTTTFQCTAGNSSALPIGSSAHALNNSESGFAIDIEFTCQNWRA